MLILTKHHSLIGLHFKKASSMYIWVMLFTQRFFTFDALSVNLFYLIFFNSFYLTVEIKKKCVNNIILYMLYMYICCWPQCLGIYVFCDATMQDAPMIKYQLKSNPKHSQFLFLFTFQGLWLYVDCERCFDVTVTFYYSLNDPFYRYVYLLRIDMQCISIIHI